MLYLPATTATTLRCPIFNRTRTQAGRDADAGGGGRGEEGESGGDDSVKQ